MNCSGCNRSLTGSDRQLVEAAHHIPGCVQTLDARFKLFIYYKAVLSVLSRAKIKRQGGPHFGAECTVNHVKFVRGAVRQFKTNAISINAVAMQPRTAC